MKKSQNILITGTSSGFGNITAKTLAKEGHHVYATMRDTGGHNKKAKKELENWAKNQDVSLEVVELDISKTESIKKAVDKIIKKAGNLDVVINNAGLFALGINEAFSVKNVEQLFDVNVFGQVRVNHAVLPHMRKQGSGLIIQLSSVGGRAVLPFVGVYNATKWAIEALTESYHYDLAQLGIECVMVEPGAYPTRLIDHNFKLDHKKIENEYGPVKETMDKYIKKFDELVKGHQPQEPQEVADAISDLINMNPGERPLRTVVDHNKSFVDEMNEQLKKIDEGYLKMFEVENLNKFRKKAS